MQLYSPVNSLFSIHHLLLITECFACPWLQITSALASASMYDKAGALMERTGDAGRALEAYARGHAYRPAVELARRCVLELAASSLL
jgi:hypothetical protein